MLTKFEANSVVQNVQNVEIFWQKIEFLKNILTDFDTILQDVAAPKTIV